MFCPANQLACSIVLSPWFWLRCSSAAFHARRSRFESPFCPLSSFLGPTEFFFLSRFALPSGPRFESPFHPSWTLQDVLSSSLQLFSGIFGPPRLEPPSPWASRPRHCQLCLLRLSLSSLDGNLCGGTGRESNPRDTCLAKVPAHVRSSALDPSTIPAPPSFRF